MPEEIPDPTVGGEEPRKPAHSLPRYSEPTPETHRKLSRETEAELALKHTVFTRGTRWLLIALFLLTIASVPAIQLATELRSPRTAGGLATFDIYKALPAWAKIRAVRGAADHLASPATRRGSKGRGEAARNRIGRFSVVAAARPSRCSPENSAPATNRSISAAMPGFFYRPDVDYITGPPFLDPSQMRRRTQSTGCNPIRSKPSSIFGINSRRAESI